MNALILYALLTPALYYLLAKAAITEWLWGWYECRWPRFGAFMTCPACSGTWYGAAVGAFGYFVLDLPFLGVESAWSVILVAGGAMVWTPIVAAWHARAMRYIGGEVE